MSLHSTEAIVVGGHQLGEADRIIGFSTRRFGKVRAVAAGVRRIRSRFGGSLELFTYGQLVYFERPGRDLHRVNEFEVLQPFRTLRGSLELFAAGAYVVELSALTSLEGEANEPLFGHLLRTLSLLNERGDVGSILRRFEIRLLRLLGYLPELYRCVRCRTTLSAQAGYPFSPSEGGLLCEWCARSAEGTTSLSPGAVGFLRGALRSAGESGRVILRAEEATALHGILRRFLEEKLGRRVQSARFLSGFVLDTPSTL
ncbi:MAG: DNA repair protein RecO [Candidatus Methylomirabilales bacterium]